MTRYTIQFTLTTPILAPQRAMVWLLDRWLAGAAAVERFPQTMTMRYPGYPDWVPETDLSIPLRWDTDTTVYATTQARFPLGGEWGNDYRTKKAIPDVAPSSQAKTFMGSGIFKATHTQLPIWQIPLIEFEAEVMDIDRLDHLLDILYNNGIGGDRTRGFGSIDTIEVTAVATNVQTSCLWDSAGHPTRPIPWNRIPASYQASCRDGLAQGTLQLIHQRLGVPAWLATQQVLCLVPQPGWPEAFQLPSSPAISTKEDSATWLSTARS